MRNLLGGKGANLAEMNLIGVPVPPGFTITTEVCSEYFEKGKDTEWQSAKHRVPAAFHFSAVKDPEPAKNPARIPAFFLFPYRKAMQANS